MFAVKSQNLHCSTNNFFSGGLWLSRSWDELLQKQIHSNVQIEWIVEVVYTGANVQSQVENTDTALPANRREQHNNLRIEKVFYKNLNGFNN